jgi:hypothetical protein
MSFTARRLTKRIGLAALVSFLFTSSVFGFALLGPYADWMDTTNGYRRGWEIGGPVNIAEEYRWNVPIVTYAFDRSFLDYFGSNGVRAVEQAIQILNDLPPASALVTSDYPADSRRGNWLAKSLGICDLKSAALTFLVEQLGMAEAERSIFVLRQWDDILLGYGDEISWPANLILERNFDPESLVPSHWVNGVWFTGRVGWRYPFNPTPCLALAVPLVLDPSDSPGTAVSDAISAYRPWDFDFGTKLRDLPGYYRTGLTADDVGGLRYLLSATNINLELLLEDVHGAGTNAGAFVNLAWRPGIDKVTFFRQELDATGSAVPLTYQYTDTYLTNGVAVRQQLERVVKQPDFLFSVEDTGTKGPFLVPVVRSGTSNWWNSTALDSNPGQGPGVIHPPVRIAFGRLGLAIASDEFTTPIANDWLLHSGYFRWGSCDNLTNGVFAYPTESFAATATRMPMHIYLNAATLTYPGMHYAWQLPLPYGASGLLQVSSNVTDWIPFKTVTNLGGALIWSHWSSSSSRFFRVVPQ